MHSSTGRLVKWSLFTRPCEAHIPCELLGDLPPTRSTARLRFAFAAWSESRRICGRRVFERGVLGRRIAPLREDDVMRGVAQVPDLWQYVAGPCWSGFERREIAMRLSEESHANLKKRLSGFFKPGKVRDIVLELSINAFDEECIRVHMLMDKSATADDFGGRLMDIHDMVIDSVDEEFKDLFPVFEIKKVDD